MISLYISQIKSIFIKDLLIEYSYKLRFIYTIIFIFLQLTIFYFLSSFIDTAFQKSPTSDITNIFGYFLIGICVLDISYTLISYGAIKIEEYKKTGVFEEIFILPISAIFFIIFSNAYPLLFSILKICIYLIFGFIFFDLTISTASSAIILFLVFILSFLIFTGIALIASSFSILFYRGSFISILHNTLSILIGGVIYPASTVFDINLIEWLIPMSPILELIRFSTGVIILDNGDIYKNFTILIVQSFCFIALGLLILNISLKKAFKEGRISLY